MVFAAGDRRGREGGDRARLGWLLGRGDGGAVVSVRLSNLDTTMPSYNDIEIGLLRDALSAFPSGIDSPEDHESAEYRAVVRLERAGLLEAANKWAESGKSGEIYTGLNITEFGRAELANVDSDGNGDAERTAYVNVIFIILDNPKVQLSPDDVQRIKAAVQDAPLARLREVIGWFGTVATLTDFSIKLMTAFGLS